MERFLPHYFLQLFRQPCRRLRNEHVGRHESRGLQISLEASHPRRRTCLEKAPCIQDRDISLHFFKPRRSRVPRPRRWTFPTSGFFCNPTHSCFHRLDCYGPFPMTAFVSCFSSASRAGPMSRRSNLMNLSASTVGIFASIGYFSGVSPRARNSLMTSISPTIFLLNSSSSSANIQYS